MYEKTFRKLRIKGNSPNSVQSIYLKSGTNIILRNSEHKPNKIEAKKIKNTTTCIWYSHLCKTHQQTTKTEKIHQDSLRLNS